jgi:Asparagine synthase
MTISADARIQSYLKLGYFIDYERNDCPIDFSRVDPAKWRHATEEQLLDEATNALRTTFAQLFDAKDEHVIPLSGGLDSRLILAALAELTEAKNLHTVTFGVPGSYDYDFGCQVAKHAGTRHTAIAIDGFTYDIDDLVERGRRMHAQVSMFFAAPLWQMERLFGRSVIWSGYVGDAIAGSHLYRDPSPTFEAAKRRYLKRRVIVRSGPLHRASDDDLLQYVSEGDLAPSILTYDEQVLFAEGVRKFTTPIVLMDGFTYRTPFINSPWMDFMMSVPAPLRYDEALLLKLTERIYPKLFALPTKMFYGVGPMLRRERVLATRAINKLKRFGKRRLPFLGYPPALYNDFDERFRDSPDLMRIARACLDGLERRGIVDWLDLNALWKRHQDRSVNVGDALAILSSLEINLQLQSG